MSKLMLKDGFGQKSIYLFDSVFYDLIQGKYIMKVKKPVIAEFSRRIDKYSIGFMFYFVFIGKEIEPFKNIKTDPARTDYIKENWKELLQIATNNVYPKDFSVKDGELLLNTGNYSTLGDEDPLSPPESSAIYDLLQLYPDLPGAFLFSGYSNSFIRYIELKK